METLIHADIFFFITAIAVVLLAIVLAIALVYAVLILKNLHRLSETVKTEADNLADDLERIRAKASGLSWAIARKLLRKLFKR